MEGLLKDVRYGVRVLLKNPLVSGIAVLSLALGIGANTAMYSWLQTVLLEPLTVAEPDRFVQLHIRHPGGFDFGSYSHLDLEDQRAANSVFSHMAGTRALPLSFSDGTANERIFGSMVSGDWFEMMGARAALGRVIGAADDEVPGRDAVAVIKATASGSVALPAILAPSANRSWSTGTPSLSSGS